MGFFFCCYCVLDHMLSIQGLRRWYFLKLFIHPLLLISCELYMAGRTVFHGVVAVSVYPYMLISYAGVWMSLALRRGASHLVVIMGLDDASIIELYGLDVAEEEETHVAWFDAWQDEDPSTSITVSTAPRVFSLRYGSTMVFDLPTERGFIWMSEQRPKETPLVDPGYLLHTWIKEEEEEEEEGEGRPIALREVWNNEDEEKEEEEEERLVRKKRSINTVEVKESRREEPQEDDSVGDTHECEADRNMSFRNWAMIPRQVQFHEEYARRWNGLDKVIEHWIEAMRMELGIGLQDLLGDMKTHMTILEQRFGGLVTSMQWELEMAYVEQSCLCWEALQRQQRRFQELTAAGSSCGSYSIIAEKFQQFHVSMERFLENERYDGRYEATRYWNYIHSKLISPIPLLLQVPHIPEEDQGGNEEKMTAVQVLTIIDKCIETFYRFLDEDDAIKPRKKLRKFQGSVYSPVEQVNDLVLFDILTEETRKREECLKEIQKGKKKQFWKRKKKMADDSGSNEVLFSMIDTKLVARVLKMSTIPREHLRWCEETLKNVDVSGGRVSRNATCSFLPIVEQQRQYQQSYF